MLGRAVGHDVPVVAVVEQHAGEFIRFGLCDGFGGSWPTDLGRLHERLAAECEADLTEGVQVVVVGDDIVAFWQEQHALEEFALCCVGGPLSEHDGLDLAQRVGQHLDVGLVDEGHAEVFACGAGDADRVADFERLAARDPDAD